MGDTATNAKRAGVGAAIAAALGSAVWLSMPGEQPPAPEEVEDLPPRVERQRVEIERPDLRVEALRVDRGRRVWDAAAQRIERMRARHEAIDAEVAGLILDRDVADAEVERTLRDRGVADAHVDRLMRERDDALAEIERLDDPEAATAIVEAAKAEQVDAAEAVAIAERIERALVDAAADAGRIEAMRRLAEADVPEHVRLRAEALAEVERAAVEPRDVSWSRVALAAEAAGEPEMADRLARRAGLEPFDGERRELPSWFLGFNGPGFAGRQDPAEVADLEHDVQTLRWWRDRDVTDPDAEAAVIRDNPDTRFVVIAGEVVAAEPLISALNEPNVIAVVVGHYYSGDPLIYEGRPMREGYGDRTRALASFLRAYTDAPIVLAVPVHIFVTFEHGRLWIPEADGDMYDAYAMFAYTGFAAVERFDLDRVRADFDLRPERPVFILDLIGFRRSDGDRAAISWRNRRDAFVARLRDQGVRGVVFAERHRQDAQIMDRLLADTPRELTWQQ